MAKKKEPAIEPKVIDQQMGDILSEMYILSAALKRWEDEGRQETDLPLLQYAAADAFSRIQTALDGVIANLPARWAAWLLRVLTLPGRGRHGPDGALTVSADFRQIVAGTTAGPEMLSLEAQLAP